jgi:hypothetical protein
MPNDRTALWTPQEAERHLRDTFNANCRMFPDIMGPWLVMATDAPDGDQVSIMRAALRGTIAKRYPNKGAA